MANRIKVNDKVIVIAGKDKGRTGVVLRMSGKDRIVVEGVNIVKKHKKPRPPQEQGGIVELEAPLHISNVSLVDDKGKPSRVGFKALEDGRKVRVFKRTGEVVDV